MDRDQQLRNRQAQKFSNETHKQAVEHLILNSQASADVADYSLNRLLNNFGLTLFEIEMKQEKLPKSICNFVKSTGDKCVEGYFYKPDFTNSTLQLEQDEPKPLITDYHFGKLQKFNKPDEQTCFARPRSPNHVTIVGSPKNEGLKSP